MLLVCGDRPTLPLSGGVPADAVHERLGPGRAGIGVAEAKNGACRYAAYVQDFERGVALVASDDVLDNITLFWLTNTAISAARLYWENKYNYFPPGTSPSRWR
jgi:hypothetical protein